MSGGPPWLVQHDPRGIAPAPHDRTYPLGTLLMWTSRGYRVHLDGYRWPASAVVLEAPLNGQHGRLLTSKATLIGHLLNSGRGISLAAHRDLERAGFCVIP